MSLRISVLKFSFLVMTFPRYLNLYTCLILFSPIRSWDIELFILLTPIYLVFLQMTLILSSHFFFSAICRGFYSLIPVYAMNIVIFIFYVKIADVCQIGLIILPGSLHCKVFISLLRKHRKRRKAFSILSIFVYLLNIFSIHKQNVFSYDNLWFILVSFLKNSININWGENYYLCTKGRQNFIKYKTV